MVDSFCPKEQREVGCKKHALGALNESLVEVFNYTVGLWGVVDIQMAYSPDVLEVRCKIIIQELSPTITTQTGYAAGIAVDFHPSFVAFIGFKGFRLGLQEGNMQFSGVQILEHVGK